MLFNSPVYLLIFLPLVFIFYFILNHFSRNREAKAFLLFGSLFFYAWYNIFNLPLIIFSICFNFLIGRYISSHSNKLRRKQVAFFAIVVNLSLLGFFKYLGFVLSNLNVLLYYLKLNIFGIYLLCIWLFLMLFVIVKYSRFIWSVFFLGSMSFIGIMFALDKGMCSNSLNLTLPLAISFFTFQQVAYIIDTYRQKTNEYDFGNYALFVSFFPQLIAGPIVHHKEMMPQFASKRRKTINVYNVYRGLQYIAFGLFKKVVIADTLSNKVVDVGLGSYKDMCFVSGWFFVFAYTLQLYFDFSGYCDMARGSGFLLNIKLPVNFNSPYKAVNIQDFWRRWHISLSTFLRDYIYIPLGGSRVAAWHIYSNILVTFILGGIWHGAGWNFLLWGIWHGVGIVMFLLFKKIIKFSMPSCMARFITFIFVSYGWVFFRAENFLQIKSILSSISGLKNISNININLLRAYTFQFSSISLNNLKFLIVIGFVFALAVIIFIMPNTQQVINIMHSKRKLLNHYWYIAYSAFIGFVLSIGIFFALSVKDSPFIYFNF